MTSRNNRNYYFLSIALLLAGLFYFQDSFKKNNSSSVLKPSQLDFSKANQFPSEDFTPAETTQNEVSLGNTLQLPPFTKNDLQKWQSLEEILKSKNDNDPRINAELKNLSTEFHEALYSKYASMKPEDRNERGTLVFLIARDLKSPNDLDFLQKVYQESPCLNLANCQTSTEEDPHHGGANQTTLDYPQLVGLYQLDRQLGERPEILKDANLRAGVYATLKNAENFPAPQVHQKAQQIREKYGL